MNKAYETNLTWMWTKNNITYKATLYKNTFIVINASINDTILVIIKNLTAESQKNIIKNMHSNIKKDTRVIYNG